MIEDLLKQKISKEEVDKEIDRVLETNSELLKDKTEEEVNSLKTALKGVYVSSIQQKIEQLRITKKKQDKRRANAKSARKQSIKNRRRK